MRAFNQPTDTLVIAEQIEAICKNQLLTLPINCLLALSVAAIVRSYVDVAVVAAWLTAVITVNVIRFFIAAWRRSPTSPPEDSLRHLRLNAIASLVCGVIWAFVPAYMLQIASPQATFLLFVLAGITAGATVQAGSYALINAAFIFPVLAMIVAKYLIVVGDDNYIYAFDTVLYLAFLLKSTSRSEAVFKRMVILNIEATSLAASLEREHAASKAAAERLYDLANNDALTGLKNRAAFATQLGEWFERSAKAQRPFFLFLLDLDHFKSVNDTLGHGAGDIVLMEVATRLSQAIDADRVVARLGGDEFAVLLADPSSDERAFDIAERIMAAVSGAFLIGDRFVNIGVSIGIAKYPEDGETPEDLLARADLSLYAAKDGGRQRWRRFDATLLAAATKARDIEHDLSIGIATGDLQVWFQPQIALHDHTLTGLEALIRWNHPTHGWVAPPLIVASALRIRKSDVLTGYVLEQACRQIRALNEMGRPDAIVAVNISPSELAQHDVPALVRHVLASHDIDPGRLELEITEEAFAASDSALATLDALSATGVRLAIDDFGTGYSSIAYLRTMKVDRIKIDRGFISGFADRAGDRILVQAILGIGRSFGIEVLAEGVETAEEVVLLQSFGCHVVQGYHFGAAMPPAGLATWMTTHAQTTGQRDPAKAAERLPVSVMDTTRIDRNTGPTPRRRSAS